MSKKASKTKEPKKVEALTLIFGALIVGWAIAVLRGRKGYGGTPDVRLTEIDRDFVIVAGFARAPARSANW